MERPKSCISRSNYLPLPRHTTSRRHYYYSGYVSAFLDDSVEISQISTTGQLKESDLFVALLPGGGGSLLSMTHGYARASTLGKGTEPVSSRRIFFAYQQSITIYNNMSETNQTTGSKRGLRIGMIIGGAVLIAASIALSATLDIPKWLFMGMFMGGAIIICYSFFIGIPKREARRYVDSNGRFDMATPRSYTAKEVSAIQSFMGSGSPFKRNRIQQFDYADGRVLIRMANGDEISAPLTEIEMIVRKDPKGEGPTGYEVVYGEEKINIVHNTAAFEELEIEDMVNILMRCSAVREPKSLKIIAGLRKGLSFVEDSAGGSDNPVDTLMEDKVASMISGSDDIEIIGGGEDDTKADGSIAPEDAMPHKSGKIKKIIFWTLGILAALVVGFIIFALASPDPEIDNWDENRPGYLIGVAGSGNLVVLRVEMDKKITMTKKDVVSYDIPFGEVQDLSYKAEDGGPWTYEIIAEGMPSQAFRLEYTTTDDDKIILEGTYTNENGQEVDTQLVILQPEEGEGYYFGKIGGIESLFTLKNDNDGNLSGTIIAAIGQDGLTLDIVAQKTGIDEYGDPIYAISSPDNDSLALEVTWWSNGGESGFTGSGFIDGQAVEVSAECITFY